MQTSATSMLARMRRHTPALLLAAALLIPSPGSPALGQTVAAAPPWMNRALSPDERAELIRRELTVQEALTLVRGYFGAFIPGAPPPLDTTPPAEALGAAGYVPGLPRLGIPALQESDSGLGVSNESGVMRPGDEATALPAALLTASSWNPTLAYEGGAMIGREARAKGFNVLLAGSVNLTRDPQGGRNFEYLGEDPLLAGVMAGESIRGVQDQRVISTVKHFALNSQETGRKALDAIIDEGALRESDLLAFELAIERGAPGAVMCAFNRVNAVYACENRKLLTEILKRDWGYRGWVMSDWGAVHSTVDAALNGLDQQSAYTFDDADYFGEALATAVREGRVPESRLWDMVHRILRTMFAVGTFDHPAPSDAIDEAAHAAIAQQISEEGIVLLKNQDEALPLSGELERIAIIGGHADVGVLSGGGSSQVMAFGGAGAKLPAFKGVPATFGTTVIYHPSSPLRAIRAVAPRTRIAFADGSDVEAAVELARSAQVTIVFATKWQTEGLDAADLSLPGDQDRLIEALAAANPRTIVVLETGNPVLMPWLSRVPAVLQAWYPGSRGGEAIARILFGIVNPSGKLPITFPRDPAQLPRPRIVGAGSPPSPSGSETMRVHYTEGAAVGYKWFEARKHKPLFAFGHGLSYTRFRYDDLVVEGGAVLKVRFNVSNTGARAGSEVAQVYVSPPGGGVPRLAGWSKVAIEPGKQRSVTIEVDPRLIASFDTKANAWRVAGGQYAVKVGASSIDVRLSGAAALAPATIDP